MRNFFPNLATLTLSVVLAVPVGIYAQNTASKINPSDVYFRAYLVQEEGLKLMERKSYAAAYYKFYDAAQLFDSVSQADPNWEPSIVEYRRKRVRELLEESRIAEKIRREKAAAAKGTVNPESEPAPTPEGMGATPLLEARAALPGRSVENLVQGKSAEIVQKIAQLEAKNDALQREIGMRDEKLRQNGKEMLNIQAAQNQMLERLKQAETKVETANAKSKREQQDLRKQVEKLTAEKEELRSKLAETAELLQKSTETNLATLNEVQQAHEQIKMLTTERDQLRQEKLDLEELVGGGNPGGRPSDAFMASHKKLKQQLAEAQTRIQTLQTERDQAKASEASMKTKVQEDQKLITQLQTELEAARTELVTLKAQNADYEQQMAAVQARLTETEQALGQAGSGNGITDLNALKENKVLHEMVLKLMKQQAGRMKAKEQTMQLLEDSSKISQDLLNSLTEMAAPYELTPTERSVLNAMGTPLAGMPGSPGNGLQIEIVGDVGGNGAAEGSGLPDSALGGGPKGTLDRQGLPPELKAYATAAETHFKNQEFVQAEESYTRILESEPRNVYALCNLAVVQMRRNKLSEVEVHLKKALAYDYDNAFAHLLLGSAYLRQTRYPDALASIQESLKIQPENSEAHAALGFLHWQLKNYKESEKALVEALKINPKNGDAHIKLATLYALNEQFDLTKSHYKKALEFGATADPALDRIVQN